jgi:hypothetical protein
MVLRYRNDGVSTESLARPDLVLLCDGRAKACVVKAHSFVIADVVLYGRLPQQRR